MIPGKVLARKYLGYVSAKALKANLEATEEK
jgi:hypothetical protein